MNGRDDRGGGEADGRDGGEAPGGLYAVRPSGRQGWLLRAYRGGRDALLTTLAADGVRGEVREIVLFLRVRVRFAFGFHD